MVRGPLAARSTRRFLLASFRAYFASSARPVYVIYVNLADEPLLLRRPNGGREATKRSRPLRFLWRDALPKCELKRMEPS